ncbi:unannotated protein [freshwater metagenome]|uniref:Unannotated protein n=1 Tax=freshwater metagenome TaxID=449393 RepID=A0A6J7HVH4_9ZZZZ|nr:hypothetical protein [Actinomycetota bacterium]
MSALRIRALLQRSRRRLLIALVVLGLGGAIAVHHGMPEGMSMEGMHSDHVAAMCMGIIAVGTAIAVVYAGVRRKRRRRTHLGAPPILRLADALTHHPPVVRARAGPPVVLFLQLGVFRR